MFPENIITEFVDARRCSINISLVKKNWHKGAKIVKYNGNSNKLNANCPEYILVEHRLNDEFEEPSLKVSISQEEALELIHDLKLRMVESPCFSGATTFQL